MLGAVNQSLQPSENHGKITLRCYRVVSAQSSTGSPGTVPGYGEFRQRFNRNPWQYRRDPGGGRLEVHLWPEVAPGGRMSHVSARLDPIRRVIPVVVLGNATNIE